MNKELLKLKKKCRKSLPTQTEELSKIILNIFSIKYSLNETDFLRKLSTCVNLSNNFNYSQCINECPLSDKSLLPLFSEGSGISRVIYKLLLEISDETPAVTYAPMLFPLISFLTTYLSELEIKNVVVTLLEHCDMIPSSTNDWNVHCHLLPVLGRKYATKAFASLRNNSEIDREQINFWPYAVWSLPQNFLVKVLICYFIEGTKVLIRAGLIIWKETVKRHGNQHGHFDLREELFETAKTIGRSFTPQSFLNRMFRIRNLSQESVTRCKRGLVGRLRSGEWISPTSSKGYVAFKTKDVNPSNIVSHLELIEIIRHMNPYLAQINKPISIFATNKHGYSLRTLFNTAEETSTTLLLIETAVGEVVGAFCADPWSLKGRQDIKLSYGKGECFVFKVRPKPLVVYRWTQDRENALANMFQRATNQTLEVGGGALRINSDLSKGSSVPSVTFNSPCLTEFSKEDFLIKSLELLAFEEIH